MVVVFAVCCWGCGCGIGGCGIGGCDDVVLKCSLIMTWCDCGGRREIVVVVMIEDKMGVAVCCNFTIVSLCFPL